MAADTYPMADTDTCANQYAVADAHTQPHEHIHPMAVSHANTYGDAFPNVHTNDCSNGDANSHANSTSTN